MSRSTKAPIAAAAREGMGARAGEPRNYVGIVRAIVLVVLAWMYVLRWVWEAKIFDRFFGYDVRERPVRSKTS